MGLLDLLTPVMYSMVLGSYASFMWEAEEDDEEEEEEEEDKSEVLSAAAMVAAF
jgi:hypothetical protein